MLRIYQYTIKHFGTLILLINTAKVFLTRLKLDFLF